MDTPVWFKSSYSSANGQCVECARTPVGGMAVRDSKHTATPHLTFSRTAWQLFTNTIKNPLSGGAAVVPRLALLERIVATPPGPRLCLPGDADHTSPNTIPMDSGNTEEFARESNTPDVPDIDPTKPHTARIYDYGLGGKNHFAADRELTEKVFAAKP